jgi:catechol 2,3-dioxygenase-like lactoylglutathione lyase family enzyme
MGIQLTKDSVDLGIVVRDADKALAFYRDLLGFVPVGESAFPGGGTMHRLMCGASMIKLVALGKVPEAANPPGGIVAASGYRYWTISVSNLDEVVAAATKAGVKIAMGRTEIRPGISIAMLEDPDGNWVELLEAG